jgi:4-hydroxy-2-oxoheptanedioate aldolase
MARGGADYVCVDLQHGLMGVETAVSMMHAIEAGGSQPIVRVPSNDAAAIGWVLDAGARGVIVPMIDDEGDAAAAVKACRYPPRGGRSFGPARAREVWGSGDPAALEQAACIVMIETRGALDNLAKIVRTEGVDAVYIGPSDLSLAMGMPPGAVHTDPAFLDVAANIVAECGAASVCPGIHAPGGESARYTELGFAMITVAADLRLLAAGVQTALRQAREGEHAPPPADL